MALSHVMECRPVVILMELLCFGSCMGRLLGLPAASENVAFVSPIHQLIFLIGSASSPTLSNLSLWPASVHHSTQDLRSTWTCTPSSWLHTIISPSPVFSTLSVTIGRRTLVVIANPGRDGRGTVGEKNRPYEICSTPVYSRSLASRGL
jgi:hypothetical protein